MKIYKKILIPILLLVITFSCNDSESITEPEFSIPSDSVVVSYSPIDSPINLKLIEKINPLNRNLELFCYTEEYYPLSGSRIISSFSRDNDTLKIKFKELEISTVGLTFSSPAAVYFDLDSLSDGVHFLKFIINGRIIYGQILSSPESYILTLQRNNILNLYTDTLFRIPKETIWGSAGSVSESPYKEFLDSLIILGAEPYRLAPGDYFYFEVYSDTSFNNKRRFGTQYGENFLYNFPNDTLICKNLIKRFSKRYYESISIYLTGGRGEVYNSAILRDEPF